MKSNKNSNFMTVNQRVSGSSPEGGAKENQALTKVFVSAFLFLCAYKSYNSL
jgi:hypothetical protein